MNHLGDRITSFVDGELSDDARERVLAHLADCGQCRADADAERRIKQRLASLSRPEPSATFLLALLAIGADDRPQDPPSDAAGTRPMEPVVQPETAFRFGTSRTVPWERVDARRPAGNRGAGPSRGRGEVVPSRPGALRGFAAGRRGRIVVAGAFSVAAATFGTAAIAGAFETTTAAGGAGTGQTSGSVVQYGSGVVDSAPTVPLTNASATSAVFGGARLGPSSFGQAEPLGNSSRLGMIEAR